MSLIGLAFAVAATVLAFRRDFKEAAGVFAVGIVSVLLATPAGVSLLRDTVSSVFGARVMAEIRSYRRVFDLERRIYRVDRIRLNPGGVPVRGVVYFLARALRGAAGGASAGPGAARAAAALVSCATSRCRAMLAAALAVVRVEGRPFHLAAAALVRSQVGRGDCVGFTAAHARAASSPVGLWRPEPIVMLPDGSDARLRRFRYTGPGALRVMVAHRRKAAGGPSAWTAHTRSR